MTYFVPEGHIVRKIWGKADTILLIFAGSAAEFALNKAVDWLYYTGRIPSDPIGRLFSTVTYSRKIIFSETQAAYAAIDIINSIHGGVEVSRGAKIPDWAFRDVLYMLIHYSIASFEVLEKKLSNGEKNEVYEVFQRVGLRMQIPDLPADYSAWELSYLKHQQEDLVLSTYTSDLFQQYKKHLGSFRYRILIESQKLVLPAIPAKLLGLTGSPVLKGLIPLYKFSRNLRADRLLKMLLLPKMYRRQILELDT